MLRERIFGAALIAIGLFASYPRIGLPFGALREPGAGFFPVVAGIALIAFAALALFTREPQPDNRTSDSGALARIGILTAAIVAYGALLPVAGFVSCTFVLLVVTLRLGRVPWATTLAAAPISSVACYALFTRLGMPLPAGFLGF